MVSDVPPVISSTMQRSPAQLVGVTRVCDRTGTSVGAECEHRQTPPDDRRSPVEEEVGIVIIIRRTYLD